ncbi:hypothetical protein N2152v2_008778 [Parachlorella kessleri]
MFGSVFASTPAWAVSGVRRRGQRTLSKVARVPDCEGPGSGSRMYPEEFPYMVHTSVPLAVEDREPAGVSALQTTDAGPSTGHRRRPSAVDADARRHPPRLPHPAEHKDLKREVALRHSPEVVLQEPHERP